MRWSFKSLKMVHFPGSTISPFKMARLSDRNNLRCSAYQEGVLKKAFKITCLTGRSDMNTLGAPKYQVGVT